MKNNKIMRLATILLVAFLATTYGVSGTYAKYTTADSADDSARVAKWGIKIETSGETFSKQYTNDSIVIVESAQTNIVAPGTGGKLSQVTITGTTEVAVRVSQSAKLTLKGWTVDGAYYCPIKITVNDTVICGLGYDTAEAFANAVIAEINGISKDYEPNETLSAGSGITVSWSWDFIPSHTEQTNEKDGALGQLAEKPTISLSIVTTAAQID